MVTEHAEHSGDRPATGEVTGVVVVAHGGRSENTSQVTALQPAPLRMIPVARAIRAGLQGTGAVVIRPLFRVRGWNGDLASPVADLTETLDGIGSRYGAVPVVLVGHSMGARAVMRAAGHPLVAAAGGLAPWLPPGEPVGQLAGRQVLLVHSDADRITRPADTWAYAERARAVTTVAAIEIRGTDHAMLRRAPLWHRIAADFARQSLDRVADPDGFDRPPGPGAVTDAFRAAAVSPDRTVV